MLKTLTRSVCILLAVTTGISASAQSITLTSPASAVNVNEGDDFATKEVGQRWDMDYLRDIPFDVGFSEPSVASGIWSAQSISQGAYYFPLFRGYSTATYTNYFSYYDNGIPYGPLNPVYAPTYSSLAFKTSIPQANRSNMQIWWTTSFSLSETTDGNKIAFVDGDKAHNVYVYGPDGYRMYDIDLTTTDLFRDRVQPGTTTMFDSPVTAGSWAGFVYGFYINPSDTAVAGVTDYIDWIRLYNPDTSPTVSIEWSTSGVPTSDNNYTIQLYVDTDNSSFDGQLLMTGIVNDGTYSFRTAALPPGTYYVYLKLVYRNTTTFDTLATSDYSAGIVINACPAFDFLSPSFTSGVDYATTDLGDPWDMSSSSDLYTNMHISNLSFADGVLTGQADPPSGGATESDSQIWLNTKSGGSDVPIDTTKYRYATISMNVDTTGYTNIYDRIYRGWVSRYAWAKSDWADDGTVSKDVPILEDWHTYSVDLWSQNFVESAGDLSAMSQAGWTNIQQANIFRFDPLEVPTATAFQIDYVKLCAINAPENNQYTIRWNATDSDSATLSITLYYGYYDSNNTFHETSTPITSTTQAPGTGSYTWDTTGISAGEYYIRASVSDGTNTLSRLSRVPVVIPSGSSTSPYVRDGANADIDMTTSTTLTFNWGNFYDESLHHYEVAIGNSSNATDVLSWTPYTNTTYTWSGTMTAGKAYYCSVQGVDANGTAVVSQRCSDGVTCVSDKLVTVYRLYSVGAADSTGEHLFTTSKTEHDVLDSWASWTSEGVGWYSFDTEEGDAGALYRLYCPYWRQHHYTTSLTEYSSLAADTATWNAEGIQYYVFTSAMPGSSPAYRFYLAANQAHHFTIDTNEVHQIETHPEWGYVAEGVAYYVFSTNGE